MSKHRSSVIDTLIDLSQAALDQASRLLADNRRTEQQVSAQLETLQRYRLEYSQQLQMVMQEGIDPASLQNYRGFIGTLDAAIERARNSLANQQAKVEQSQIQWQAERRKLHSYDTLLERRAASGRVAASRAELRLADELSARMLSRQNSFTRSFD